MDTLELRSESVTIDASSGWQVYVTITKPDVGEILNAIGLKEVIAHFDVCHMLDQIGKDVAIEHFDIVEKDEDAE